MADFILPNNGGWRRGTSSAISIASLFYKKRPFKGERHYLTPRTVLDSQYICFRDSYYVVIFFSFLTWVQFHHGPGNQHTRFGKYYLLRMR